MKNGILNRIETGDAGRLNTLLYLPTNYDPNKKYPTICFLHGSGEGGTDLNKQLSQGLPWVYQEHINKGDIHTTDLDKFIMIAIQAGYTSVNPATLVRAIFELKEIISIDTDRIYCTGLSAGGNKTIAAVQAFPHVFAAVAPMSCGQWYNNFDGFKNVKAWFMHGISDRTAAFSRSVRDVNMINDLYPGNAVLKSYKGGHGFWKEHYEPAWRWTSENALIQDIGAPNGLNLYDWFLQYSLSDFVNHSKPDEKWKAEYWNTPGAVGPDSFYQTPVKTEQVDSVDFAWGSASPTGVDNNQFAARFTKNMSLPTGKYRITLASDDGAKVVLNEKLAINLWGYHDLETESIEVDLAAGVHKIQIYYFEAHGDATCKFRIESIGEVTEPVDPPTEPEQPDPVEKLITKVIVEYSDGTQKIME